MSQSTTSPGPEALLSHADFVRALARSLLHDSASADDLTQNTLLRALERPPRSQDAVRGWLWSVARNFARQDARGAGRRRHHEALAARDEALPSAADVLEREAMRSEVVEALLALPDGQRDVLLLRYYEGIPPREIARRLDVPVETVRTRMKRGLARMRQALDGRRSRRDWMSALVPLAGGAARGPALWLFASAGKQAALAVCVLALGVAWWVARPGAPPPPVTTAAETVAPLLADESPDKPRGESDGKSWQPALEDTRSAVADADLAPAEVVVSGHALAPDGAPLAEASVYLSSEGPLAGSGPARAKIAYVEAERGSLRLTDTDEGGAFRFVLAEPGPVHVGFVRLADPALYPGDALGVDAPLQDLELRAVPAQVATLAVRATLLESGADVTGYSASLWSTVTSRYSHGSTDGTQLELEVPLAEGHTEEAFDLTIEHASLGKAQQRVILRPAARTEVQLLFDGNLVVRGVVVDEQDRPVEGALVYFGIQELLRGDEPFKPYDPARVKNGVRSDGDGAFELTGKGTRITAWHDALSPRTVTLEEAERIVLAPRSAVAGVLLDDSGAPVVGAELVMDRVRKALTDGDGRFRFDGLEAGIRGIKLASGRMFALDVPPAATLEVELSAGLPQVTIELQQNDLPYGLNPKDYALLVGEGRVFSVQDRPVIQGLIELEQVLPGDYWLLTASGLIARARVDAARVPADVGSSSLTIRAAAGRQLFVAPAAANELVWLMANRVAQQRVPASGELEVGPLPPGTYIVGAEDEGELGRVDVTGPGTILELE